MAMCELEQHRTLSNTVETKEMQTSIKTNGENKKKRNNSSRSLHETTNRARKKMQSLYVVFVLVNAIRKPLMHACVHSTHDASPRSDGGRGAMVVVVGGAADHAASQAQPIQGFRAFCLHGYLDGLVPDAVISVKVLAACSESAVMRQAFCLHGYLVNTGFWDKVFG
jgi:hypothetical protein